MLWGSCVRKSSRCMTGRDAIEFSHGRFDVFRGAIDMAHGRRVEVSVITRQVAVSDNEFDFKAIRYSMVEERTWLR